MTQKLIDEGYIIKEPYREITLTSEGIKAANELYTPSVILQDFLENRVGVERKNAENDSVAIVSQISDDALDKLVTAKLVIFISLDPAFFGGIYQIYQLVAINHNAK